jgi:hypothetical protein
MYYFILDIIYKFLAYFFYYIGDIAWRIPAGWAYDIYFASINKSIKYDELSGRNLWKEPEQETEE